jgi:hypothetical protein
MEVTMAGVITHMVVAREISKRLPMGTIEDMGQFYLGNLAPDAIHVREGYIRDFKKHTHLRDGIRDMELGREENRTLFHNRVTDFINEYGRLEDGLLDLYRGYVSHLLTDELFVLTIREHFCKTLEQLDIPQTDPRFFEYIVTDMTRNDFLLVTEYEGSDEIRECMEQTAIHPVKGYLSADEINETRNWLIKQHYYEKREKLQPRYISLDETLEFIQAAAEDIVKRLSENTVFPKMF